MALIILDVCLSDIPKEAMKQGSNGKWYTKICCADRREPDQYGNTHSLYMSQTQEQRQSQTPKQYVGSAKAVQVTQPQQPQPGYPAAPQYPQQPQQPQAPQYPQQGYPQQQPQQQQPQQPQQPAQPTPPNMPF